MDYVITWVNNQDPIWQECYKNSNPRSATIAQAASGERFRDYGYLKYHFRGIAKNLPWIDNVYLVVSNIEQVPEWINQDTVKVVLHGQIIPEKYLPTFNSCTIEMFLKNIPGLSEEFIYANDDMYIINPCEPEDFFKDGKPLIHLNQGQLSLAGNQFKKVVSKQYNIVKQLYPSELKPHYGNYFKPEHLALGHLKSMHQEVWSKLEKEIENSISTFRESYNFNQYLFTFATVFSGHYIDKAMDGEYTSIANIPNIDWIVNSNKKQLCLNDTRRSSENDLLKVKEALNILFPDKCKYEC